MFEGGGVVGDVRLIRGEVVGDVRLIRRGGGVVGDVRLIRGRVVGDVRSSFFFVHIFRAGGTKRGTFSEGQSPEGHSAGDRDSQRGGTQRGTFSERQSAGGHSTSAGGHGPKMPPLATGLHNYI